MRRTRSVLFDFGHVITGPQNPASFDSLLAEFGLAKEDFLPAWLLHRHDYDAGRLGPVEYWSKTLAACGVAEAARVAAERTEELVLVDMRAWLHYREAMRALIEELLGAGVGVGILSNMPPGLGARFEETWPWITRIPHRLFSAETGLIKPDAAIYRLFLERSGWKAEDTLFVDDSKVNVEGARALGFAVHHFEDEARALAAVRDWALSA